MSVQLPVCGCGYVCDHIFYWLDVTILTAVCGGGINDHALLGESGKLLICTMVIEVLSEQSTSHFYTHTECCCRRFCCCCCCSVCCYTVAVAAAAAVLLFATAARHRVPDGQIWLLVH